MEILTELKAVVAKVMDSHIAGEIELTQTAMNGLTFEDVLGLIHDDFIPMTEVGI